MESKDIETPPLSFIDGSAPKKKYCGMVDVVATNPFEFVLSYAYLYDKREVFESDEGIIRGIAGMMYAKESKGDKIIYFAGGRYKRNGETHLSSKDQCECSIDVMEMTGLMKKEHIWDKVELRYVNGWDTEESSVLVIDDLKSRNEPNNIDKIYVISSSYHLKKIKRIYKKLVEKDIEVVDTWSYLDNYLENNEHNEDASFVKEVVQINKNILNDQRFIYHIYNLILR